MLPSIAQNQNIRLQQQSILYLHQQFLLFFLKKKIWRVAQAEINRRKKQSYYFTTKQETKLNLFFLVYGARTKPSGHTQQKKQRLSHLFVFLLCAITYNSPCAFYKSTRKIKESSQINNFTN